MQATVTLNDESEEREINGVRAATLSISIPPAMRGREVALFTASSVENVPKDWNLAASPALPEGFGWRVRFADGTLWFKTLNQGLVIQFR